MGFNAKAFNAKICHNLLLIVYREKYMNYNKPGFLIYLLSTFVTDKKIHLNSYKEQC